MKVTVLPIRENGVARDRGALKSTTCYDGDLEIIDVMQPELKRMVKVARLTTTFNTYELNEAHIVWMNENKLCLTGFERVKRNLRMVDYAQSWVCSVSNHQQRFEKKQSRR